MELLKEYMLDKKDIYILGRSGIGKTQMVLNYFKESQEYDLNYLSIQHISSMNDIYKYTHGSILTLMYKQVKQKRGRH